MNYQAKIFVPIEGIKRKNSVNSYQQLIQYLIKKGKKNTIENLFRKSILYWGTLDLEYKNFDYAIENALLKTTPYVGVRNKRRGSKNINIPFKLSKNKGKFLSAKWILSTAKTKKKTKFYEGIVDEIIDSSLNKSISVKKCEELHKLAEDSLTNKR